MLKCWDTAASGHLCLIPGYELSPPRCEDALQNGRLAVVKNHQRKHVVSFAADAVHQTKRRVSEISIDVEGIFVVGNRC